MANLQKAEFTLSQREEENRFYTEVHTYRLHVDRQVATHWKCIIDKCKGRCSTIGDHITSVSEHNHPPLVNEEESRLLTRLRQRVQEEIKPVQQIYNEETQNLDEEAAATVASFYSIKSGLYRQRAKVLPPVPRTRADVDLTGSWTETTDGQQFLVVDSKDEDRILIFSTAEMLDILANAETIYMDGTFFVCPSLWQQVYIVHCLVDGQMFPVAFSLLPSKSRDTYIRLFNYLKDSVLAIVGVELSPSVVQTDYEAAAIGATERVFPDAEVRGCYFHFTQAVWRQVSEKGLVNTYKDNRAFNTHVRRAAALPLLPVDQIQDAWMEVLNQSPDVDGIGQFNDYITSTWVDYDARFPPRIWNQHGNTGPRTNNHLEDSTLDLEAGSRSTTRTFTSL
ncbi:uncharacterized protein LOC124261815 [Haliotis rubra]|uniref:uncharacterized protein LOC124261815 n=1 Tax=Haliotis rubra TaxID=36100 RepID=UPI001EE4F0D7|nr:uncharacterized protein LOC124261815 [Haliotis rubra]